MRVINFHDHYEEGIVERNQRMGFDLSVLLSVGEEDEAKGLALARERPDAFAAFAWLGLLEDIPKQVRRLRRMVKDRTVTGVKFQPLVQHFSPEEKRLFPVYETCQELAIPILFHCGVVSFSREFGIAHLARYGCPVFGVDEVAFEFPELPIVVAHLGGTCHNETIIIAAKHPNLYLDTAYLPFFCSRLLPRVEPSDLIRRAVEHIGPDRVLYGWEGTDPALISESDIDEAAKRKILGDNAARLLKLP
ncbi:MAG: amidohydrolase [Spirochaetales bacterium]|nr:amidohydrolase [Spirochaetales bacterium]